MEEFYLQTYKPTVIKVDDYEQMSAEAAKIIINLVKKKPSASLGLATGSSPVGTYERLIRDHEQNGTKYATVTTYNLDEYVGISPSHHQSYAFFMKEHLFDKIDILAKNTHIPSGSSLDLEKVCEEYEAKIKGIGGVDLQVLGVGTNGHIGFNEPGISFSSKVHVAELAQETRDSNARFFNSHEEVPKQAVTMGISTILLSKKIVLLASGKAKSYALKALLKDELNEEIPINALRYHRDVTIIADKEALSLSIN